jgi:hypothetical protein
MNTIQHIGLINQTLTMVMNELVKKDSTIKSMLLEIEILKTSFNNHLLLIENSNRELKKKIEELKKIVEEKDKIIDECTDNIFVYEMKCSVLPLNSITV